MRIKGKRYNYPNFREMMIAVRKHTIAGDTINSNANPITGEYWIEVILKGEQAKKELPNVS